jgi:hypothetical protein
LSVTLFTMDCAEAVHWMNTPCSVTRRTENWYFAMWSWLVMSIKYGLFRLYCFNWFHHLLFVLFFFGLKEVLSFCEDYWWWLASRNFLLLSLIFGY